MDPPDGDLKVGHGPQGLTASPGTEPNRRISKIPTHPEAPVRAHRSSRSPPRIGKTPSTDTDAGS